MRCPYCGARNPEDAKHCDSCGRRLMRSRRARKERSIILTGVFLILLVLLAGIAAMMAISKYMANDVPEPAVSKVKIVTTPTPTPDASKQDETRENQENEDAASASSSSGQSEKTDEAPVTAALSDKLSQIDLMGYSPITVTGATASSTIQQAGVDNSAQVILDGNDNTSWQEGVDGDGIGESLTFTLQGQPKVRFLVLKLGNWDYPAAYTENSRPGKVLFEIGDQSFTVEFPDEQKEMCVELSRELPAESLKLTIQSAYSGQYYQDNCITGMTVYGNPG